MAKIPSLPSPHSDNGGHSIGNGRGEPGPGLALRDHSLLSGPCCRSEGKGREGRFREAGAFCT